MKEYGIYIAHPAMEGDLVWYVSKDDLEDPRKGYNLVDGNDLEEIRDCVGSMLTLPNITISILS